MANLFLGFPVPRAKIASMIEGSAPPISHHTQHENGGIDEIDCTGLEGTGGSGGGYDDAKIYCDLWFESIDNFATSIGSNANISLGNGDVTIYSAEATDNEVRLERSHNILQHIIDFSLPMKFKIYAGLNTYPNLKGEIRWGVGSYLFNRFFGFKFVDGVVSGVLRNPTNSYSTQLVDYGPDAIDEYHMFEAVYTPTPKVDYYIDDVLIDTLDDITIDTDQTTGQYIYFYVRESTAGESIYIAFNRMQIQIG